ncbi:MarR family transcriptional regulator [Roseomonas stagni]|uniref:MarR family transcriptional regulator n=1 Tax=Falsiroseomonas algicola TaxID=2716930 RepID=A0A6M1LUE4_9PROT|nr:MarR family transcriptional regulator [Falsiroseomonas algicola]NGM24061.1 MarR family transcriptional regulator [Falsiroseomonas algicola]
MTPEPDLRACFGFRTRRAMRALTRHYERHLAPTGLKPTQFSVLAALRLRKHRDLTHLAELLGLERTSLLRALATLAAAGLLAPDNALTRQGEARFAAALPLWQAAQDAVAAELGEQAQAITILEQLGERLGRPARA